MGGRAALAAVIISAIVVVVCFFRAARAYDRVVERLRAGHPDLWELSGKPRPMLAFLPTVISDGYARRGLMAQLTGRLPEWVSNDPTALHYAREFRNASRALWVAFVAFTILSLVAIAL